MRFGLSDNNYVLTTRELAQMIKEKEWTSWSEESEYDDPLGESTGAAVIFG